MKHLPLLLLIICLIVAMPVVSGSKMTPAERQQYNIDQKTQSDTDPGLPHLDSTGGPDTFGYTWIDSEEAGGPTYSWVDITATGTEIAAADELDDDDRVGPYPIGFLFPFYGAGEEYFWVQSNGGVSFVPNLLGLSNQSMPYQYFGALIALFWDDLDPENGLYGSVYYDTVTIGTQDACVVSFINYSEHPPSDTSPRINMQVLLFEDGRIRLQYQSIDNGFDCTSCTVGIQNHAGNDGLSVIYNNASGNYPYAGYVVDFIPPTPTAALYGIVYLQGGAPLAGANVRCGCRETVTDAVGSYTITGLYPGTYKDIVWKSGYDAINSTTTLATGTNNLNYALSLSPTPINGPFTDDFESGGTPLFTGSGDWEFGSPTYDPNGAHSGSNAWSTILNGDYNLNRDDWLISQKGFVVQANYSLKYWHWFDYEGGYDGYNVWISTTAGAFWEMLYPTDGYSDPDGFYTAFGLPNFNNWNTNEERMWVEKEFPLGDYVGQTVWFAFRHNTDVSVVYSGVTIDDLDFSSGGTAPYVLLQLWPVNVNIPSYGGMLVYDAGITSTYSQMITGQAWTDLILPNGNSYGPLMVIPVNVMPGYRFFGNLTQNIPAMAPPGPYMFNGYLGRRPYVASMDSFPFTKTVVPGPDGEEVLNWDAEEWVSSDAPPEVVETAAQLPESFALHAVWPNPFNASATITVDLPVTANLEVCVFNLNGQEMAVLVNGQTEAGSHSLHLDGSTWASGVYFVQARLGDQVAVQKMTLLK